MASIGLFLIATWTIFKNHLLEVGLTQNQETMTLWTLTTVDLFYFMMFENLHEYKFIEIAFGWEPVTYDFTLHLRVRDTLHDFGGVLGRPLDTFFWALGSCVKWP